MRRSPRGATSGRSGRWGRMSSSASFVALFSRLKAQVMAKPHAPSPERMAEGAAYS